GKSGFDLLKATTSASDGTTTLSNADLLALTLTSPSLFAGVGGSLDANGTATDRSDDLIVTAGAVGFSASASSLKLAIVRQGASGNRYLGLEVTGLGGGLVGVPGLTFAVSSGTLQVNQATNAAGVAIAARLDWHALHAADSQVPDFAMDENIALHLDGDVEIGLASFVTGGAHFDLTLRTVDANLPGTAADLIGASLLTFALDR